MPSQLAHLFFATDTIARALPPAPFRRITAHRAALGLGAQGPDIFLHNRRSKPSALRYGTRLHRAGFGSMLAAAAEAARRSGVQADDQTAAYLYGFATHAALDRFLHPYINYRSGWYERGRPDTERLRTMHAFLERLLDTALLRARLGITPSAVPALSYLDLGDELPESIAEALRCALIEQLPGAQRDHALRTRLRNAYQDSRGYYYWAHHDLAQARRTAVRSDGARAKRLHRLAILHPEVVPLGLDVLNLSRRRWRDPCPAGRYRRESVPQLYRRALDSAAVTVEALFQLFSAPADAELGDHRRAVEAAAGNSDLSDHYQRAARCPRRYNSPLPLHRLLERFSIELSNGRG